MNKLTSEEILKYERPANNATGVKAITREFLESIDLDEVRDVIRVGELITLLDGKPVYKLDRFTPVSGSYAFKPSFAGRQMLLGKQGRNLYFSNGVWFAL